MATDVTQVKREDVSAIPKWIIPIAKPFMRLMSRAHVWMYQRSPNSGAGKFAGAPICVVGMTGRKSGKWRTIPLMYVTHGDDVILVASTTAVAGPAAVPACVAAVG